MPDLTTMHLKCLLEKAAPGPWESSAVVDAICEDWDSYLLHLYMGNTCLSQVSSVQYEDESYESLDLAALAPELAQEVIRLREHIEGLITTMENKAGVSNGRDTLQELIVAENLMSAANQLRQILLGDHDE